MIKVLLGIGIVVFVGIYFVLVPYLLYKAPLWEEEDEGGKGSDDKPCRLSVDLFEDTDKDKQGI